MNILEIDRINKRVRLSIPHKYIVEGTLLDSNAGIYASDLAHINDEWVNVFFYDEL